jgi:glutamyl-Q tRNA(Asp) synthetase
MTDYSAAADYVGRFAPSPSGPLHFGSLVAAVASYLDARASQGTWLVRMEDLDPTREPPGSADVILEQLADYGLQADGPILYQSTRLGAYQKVLSDLRARGLVYPCGCSRQQVRESGSVYDGTCLGNPPPAGQQCAIRLRVDDSLVSFTDLVQGDQQQNLARETGDFVVRRKDGLFAYQLAVVVDDAYQGITHVIRGYDLLDSTPRQIYLQRLLGYPTPRYGHVPVIINQFGQKLSKQHFAEPIGRDEKKTLLHAAIRFLGLQPPTAHHHWPVATQLDWAIAHWDIQAIPKLATMPQHDSPE